MSVGLVRLREIPENAREREIYGDVSCKKESEML